MTLSGFSICRNGIKFDYPFDEAIRSALPIVDEFIVNVGQSEDGTLEAVRSIGSDKVRVVTSYWDDSMKKDGLLFSQQTNVALSHCRGDWALYLQADEVLHERDYAVIQKALRDHANDPDVLGLTFRYLHFYGDYWSLNPWAYHRAVRIIRNNGAVQSCGDAVGFCLKEDGEYLQTKDPRRVRDSGATVYHYGWVKQGRVLLEKFRYQAARHHGDDLPPQEQARLSGETFDFPDYDIMKEFRGTHPAVMGQRIAQGSRLHPGRNRWLNPKFYAAVARRGFRG